MLREKVRIRQAGPEDLAAVMEIEHACFPQAEAAPKETLLKRLESYGDSFLLAELEDEIIGFVNGALVEDRVICDEMFADPGFHDKKHAYQAIFGLDVLPAYRKQQVARLLLDTLIEQTRRKGKKGLILTCKENLLKYYESFGFVNMGLSASVHGGATWYDMILEFEQVS